MILKLGIGRADNYINSNDFDNFIKHLFMEKYKYNPSVNQLIFFQVQKVLAEKILSIDKKYWEERNWLNRLYYFDCSINL